MTMKLTKTGKTKTGIDFTENVVLRGTEKQILDNLQKLISEHGNYEIVSIGR